MRARERARTHTHTRTSAPAPTPTPACVSVCQNAARPSPSFASRERNTPRRHGPGAIRMLNQHLLGIIDDNKMWHDPCVGASQTPPAPIFAIQSALVGYTFNALHTCTCVVVDQSTHTHTPVRSNGPVLFRSLLLVRLERNATQITSLRFAIQMLNCFTHCQIRLFCSKSSKCIYLFYIDTSFFTD